MRVLPKRNPQKVQKKWYRDSTLCRLSKEKKVAWDSWQKEGRPNNGLVYEKKVKTREEVTRRIKVCEANEERKRIQNLNSRQDTRQDSVTYPYDTVEIR